MQIEVAIIGAGAAGIAAARRLQDRGRKVLLVEAMDRVGGRAHTITVEGLALDLGCGWLHSAERNPLARFAEAENAAIDRSHAAWRNQLRNLGFSAEQQRAAWKTYDSFDQSLRDNPPPDDIAGKAIARDHPWRPYLDMISGALNGAELDFVSAKDLLAYDDSASETNWRLPAGYGTLIGGAARALPLSLATKVLAIDHQGARVGIETSKGRITADAVIVAVPTDILARGDIAFTPAVDDHLHAASCLPLGRVDKLFLAMEDADAVPPETHLLGNPHSALTGSYYLRPFGRPLIECFFGGIAARAMEEAGDVGRIAFAIEEISALLGSDFAKRLQPVAGSWWHKEATIGGAYSHALPGHADKRAILAAPADERLHFAGEACSAHDYSTAHGAWQSGLDAADRIEPRLY
ncbi:MAG TPA: NAD(P)/FAD-dependent oxidoreductase [Sphingomonas sp.]|uniref:flavin monoamine oxidase family protein n=1 Tax=Sphingomonas sp. TaxID=28214 RepID=UPI002D1AFF74|nr:NAD(P)/FAD-dependent oxidoreductase [Sphingomonas sp.]HMI18140.1 NAD(P)/FAD-dependent oxidoreductase [Sphingomonas sp.]